MEEQINREDLALENTPRISRRSRTADDRSANSREGDERAPIVFGNVSRFNVHPSILADTRYEFAYVPYILGNTEEHRFYDTAVDQKYWEKVPASEYAQAKRIHKDDPFRRRESSNDDFIRNGGQILLRRPKEICDAERRHYIEENAHKDELIAQHRLNTPGGTQVFDHRRDRGIGVKRI